MAIRDEARAKQHGVTLVDWDKPAEALAVDVLEHIKALDPQKQMQLVETLSAMICIRMGTFGGAVMVADGLHKHVRQYIDALFDPPEPPVLEGNRRR